MVKKRKSLTPKMLREKNQILKLQHQLRHPQRVPKEWLRPRLKAL